jgi:hypothetical protein
VGITIASLENAHAGNPQLHRIAQLNNDEISEALPIVQQHGRKSKTQRSDFASRRKERQIMTAPATTLLPVQRVRFMLNALFRQIKCPTLIFLSASNKTPSLIQWRSSYAQNAVRN